MLLLYIGPLSSPKELHISNLDFSLRELTFSWSPVSPDCPAIHYNILASNYGSCPTTTNHTTVTCTDVQTNISVCTFAIQTVVCGNITGNFSKKHNTNILELYPTVTTTVYVAFITSLATALIISIVALLTAIIIILTRSKAKSKAAFDLQVTNRAGRSTHMESMYEDPSPSVSAIHTQENITQRQLHRHNLDDGAIVI